MRREFGLGVFSGIEAVVLLSRRRTGRVLLNNRLKQINTIQEKEYLRVEVGGVGTGRLHCNLR